MHPNWASVASRLLVAYILVSLVAIGGWVGFGAYAAIWHNAGATYCDYNVPPGYINIINGEDCMVNWGYVLGTHGYLFLVLILFAHLPAYGGMWWIWRTSHKRSS